MGAIELSVDCIGKTVDEAYKDQVDHDLYEYGHGGYTGTLAEKDGFILIPRPPRYTAEKVEATFWLADSYYWWLEWGSRPETRPAKGGKAALDLLKKWYPKGDLDARGRGAGMTMQSWMVGGLIVDWEYLLRSVLDEKWGPALAIEQSPAERKRRWNNLPRGHKTWTFFGLAST